jgi:mannose-6-phosphate isomerase
LTPALARREVTAMGHPQQVRRVDKPWGYEIIWAVAERYVGKLLFIKAGERLSLQYHQKKDETVYVLSGKMRFEVGPLEPAGAPREDRIMGPGDAYRITPHTVHRMIAIEDTQVLEASTPELDDVVRLEDSYGRQGTSAP